MTPLPTHQSQALSSAARWYARLESGQATDQDRQAWAQWHAEDPAHRQAWQRVEAVREQLASVPGNLAAPTLQAAGRSRRQVLRGVLVVASAGSLGWMGLRSETRTQLFADLRTAVGEQRTLILADGSSVMLNTDTRINLHFDATQRTLELLSGEILVSTAADPDHRPFSVQTRHGRVLALGTQFIVRCDSDMTHVAVLEKAVQVSLPDGVRRAEYLSDSDVLCPTLGSGCYRASEKVRNRGIDLELNGALTPDWNLSAGYTFTQSKYVSGSQKGDDFSASAPRHLFKIATDYRLPGALNKARVGGSFSAQSSLTSTEVGEDYKIQQKPYTLTNLHAVYEINQNLEVQYNLDNVFDKKYLQTVGNPDYWQFYGEPRNFNLALRAKY